MKINKTITVHAVLKERKLAQKRAQKAAEEAKLQKYITETAKSIIGPRAKYILKVNNSDAFVSNSYKEISTSANSVWAPWSPFTR